ncbi:RNA methyltransferase [Marinobacter sp. M3C]|uniref:TrmH family RNA methyltransferase n=1 Tax=unclassified Marinobacter TaxID=83889 RepID=UPI00200D14DA|nr:MULTISPECIES: RNA methyltransferase [unclassified Marinobacter]MCL1479330.1 RNA methyltransferase [Marinobacter sp.]MCL1480845.1 RNA methyltransferase [Marinobacter sp.]MCL1486393.1 RNA methyltransferase [Marinobacter sp.]UQG55833.1 RNA methyltransferase [Marinobacter sp. M4C]UQG58484.1 RNA methyltransferase [Marinobacter sp. M3C]
MKLDDIKKLQQKKYREAFGHYLVEGEHLVLELQKAASTQPALTSSELYVTASYEHWQGPFTTHVISERQMARLANTQTPQGILAVVPTRVPTKVPLIAPEVAPIITPMGQAKEQPATDPQHSPEKAIYLHEVQDPGNLGTILRTLAWFGGFRCLLSPGSVDPYNPKVVRASMGAIFHVPLETDVELASLSQRFHRLACLDLNGRALTERSFADHDCYLFGNEARGIPTQALDELNATAYTINGKGQIESLNLASAVNICSWELMRS